MFNTMYFEISTVVTYNAFCLYPIKFSFFSYKTKFFIATFTNHSSLHLLHILLLLVVDQCKHLLHSKVSNCPICIKSDTPNVIHLNQLYNASFFSLGANSLISNLSCLVSWHSVQPCKPCLVSAKVFS